MNLLDINVLSSKYFSQRACTLNEFIIFLTINFMVSLECVDIQPDDRTIHFSLRIAHFSTIFKENNRF